MSNPTDRYGWNFPTENQDPWYASFADVWQAADASVNSVEQFTRKLSVSTLVISCYPTASVVLVASTTLPNAADSTVLSAAPYGKLSGSFTVPASSCNVRLDLSIRMLARHNTGMGTAMSILEYLRVVDTASRNLTGDTAWNQQHYVAGTYAPGEFTIITSLAAGTYTVEVQRRGICTSASSWSNLPATDPFLLWARIEGK